MCTDDKKCSVQVMIDIAELVHLPLRHTDDRKGMEIRGKWDFLELTVRMEKSEAWVNLRPVLALYIKEGQPTPAQLWTWYDAIEGLAEAIIRAQAYVDRLTGTWDRDEIEGDIAEHKSEHDRKQGLVGDFVKFIEGGGGLPEIPEA